MFFSSSMYLIYILNKCPIVYTTNITESADLNASCWQYYSCELVVDLAAVVADM